MIRVYYLPVNITGNTEWVTGEETMHGGLLGTTEDPSVRRLLMDTTDLEHTILSGLSVSWTLPTQEEIDTYDFLTRVPSR